MNENRMDIRYWAKKLDRVKHIYAQGPNLGTVCGSVAVCLGNNYATHEMEVCKTCLEIQERDLKTVKQTNMENQIVEKQNRLAKVKQLHTMAEVFESRCVAQNHKGKRKREAQAEFFMGAHTAEWIKDNNLVVDPIVYFSIMRGSSIMVECQEVILQLEQDLRTLTQTTNEN